MTSTTTLSQESHDDLPPRRSQSRIVFARLLSKPAAVFGMVIVVMLVACALVPDLIAPHDPYAQSLIRRLKPPSFLDRGVEGYWLGTDHLGRDTLSRIIHGARTTLLVSLFAVIVSAVAGIWAGLAAGFFGGRTVAVVL
ncbi:MAG: ABC transporter permease, partial [Nitratireductor sp.]